jgi:hypothetical protein
MISKGEFGIKRTWPALTYFLVIRFVRLSKNTKNHNQDGRTPCIRTRPRPAEHKAREMVITALYFVVEETGNKRTCVAANFRRIVGLRTRQHHIYTALTVHHASSVSMV